MGSWAVKFIKVGTIPKVIFYQLNTVGFGFGITIVPFEQPTIYYMLHFCKSKCHCFAFNGFYDLSAVSGAMAGFQLNSEGLKYLNCRKCRV